MTSEIRREVTQATIDRYGEINGDNDIIHYDHEYAVRRGYRGTLAHGLMVMGYAAELGAKEYGADWYSKGELSVVWTAPVCPGDDVVVTLDGGELRAQVDGEPVLVGRMGLSEDGEA